MKKRIDLAEYGGFLYKFIDELEGNAYYNQTWLWCGECGRRHRIDSNIALEHKVKPIPLKCEDIEDHCWKLDDDIGYFGIAVLFFLNDNNVRYFDVHTYKCAIYRCITCDKKKLSDGYSLEFIETLREELTNCKGRRAVIIESVIELLKKIKERGINGLKEIGGIDYTPNVEKHYMLPQFDHRMIEIQNLQDFIIERCY